MHRLAWNLTTADVPENWLNVAALVAAEYPRPLPPQGDQPMTVDQLARIYSYECARIEALADEYATEEAITIPDVVRDHYQRYRPTPFIRAAAFERALDYGGRIFYKSEAGNPSGSHKPNTAIAQVYNAHQQGLRGVVTDTGAGQWGTALAMAASSFGLSCEVFMTHSSYIDKPYRRHMMRLAGATVHSSPSRLTQRGRDLLAKDPEHAGSLGIGMGEAMEVAQTREDVRLCLGCMSYHAALHQTVIGQETVKQCFLADVEPDALVACVGGGTIFFGFVAPYLVEKIQGKKGPTLLAVESANAPALTQGEYRYDFADTFGFTPRYKMFTLGHEFVPPKVHAGGLRYHGKSAILSLMAKKGFVTATAVEQEEAFAAGRRFFLSEGVLPAPESAHAIACIERLVAEDKQAGVQRNLVFCLSGMGYLDLVGYAKMFPDDRAR